MDEDDGGTLDVEEVFKGLKKAGQKVTQKQAAQWIKDAAEDETATELDLEQFLALMAKRGKSGSFAGWFRGGASDASQHASGASPQQHSVCMCVCICI